MSEKVRGRQPTAIRKRVRVRNGDEYSERIRERLAEESYRLHTKPLGALDSDGVAAQTKSKR